MTPQQKEFYSIFDQVLYAFLTSKTGTLIPNTDNVSDISKKIKNLTNAFPSNSNIFKNQQIIIQGCNSTIFRIAVESTLEWVNGNWIFVSYDNKILAFHFPTNEGINLMMDVYFNSDPIINGYYVGNSEVNQYKDIIRNLFKSPRQLSLYPPILNPLIPVTVQSCMVAFRKIFSDCNFLICN